MENKVYNKIFAIPDIHGEISLLDKALELMDEQGLNENTDLVIFLGDMIDRGVDSYGVVELIKMLCTTKPHCYKTLAGNHEDFMIDAIVKKRPHAQENWDYNGGIQTMDSYYRAGFSSVPQSHLEFIAKLPTSLEFQGFFFSHAPQSDEKHRMRFRSAHISLAGQQYTRHDLTWNYMDRQCDVPGGYFDNHTGPMNDCGKGKEHLIGICGHMHRGPDVDCVRIHPKYRLLDCGTGCWPNANLAIHECIENKTWYVNNNE